MRSIAMTNSLLVAGLALTLLSSTSSPAAGSAQVWDLATDFSGASNEVTDTWSYYRPCTYGGSGGYRSREWCRLATYDTFPQEGTLLGGPDVTAWYANSCSPSFVGKRGGGVIAAPGWTCCVGGCQERVSIVFLAPSDTHLLMDLALQDTEPLAIGFWNQPATTGWTLRHLDTNVAAPGVLAELANEEIAPGGSTGTRTFALDVHEGERVELMLNVAQGGSWSDVIAVDWTVRTEPTVSTDAPSWGKVKASYRNDSASR
ncbi:hypothetical protein K8I85_16360 [bacterium]|nr:hypothetical protein [bacterium]